MEGFKNFRNEEDLAFWAWWGLDLRIKEKKEYLEMVKKTFPGDKESFKKLYLKYEELCHMFFGDFDEERLKEYRNFYESTFGEKL